MTFNQTTTLGEAKAWSALSSENKTLFDFCFHRLPADLGDDTPLSALGERKCGAILSALEVIFALQEQGRQVLYDLYTPGEIAADPDKAMAKMLFFPGDTDKPFVMVLPGGGYQVVAVLDEGIPDAVEFNRLGYSAAVVAYRVGIENIMPRPVDDLARAVQLVQNAGDEMPCDKSRYLVAGFSSGGHLAGMWSSPVYGYRQYGMTAPEAVFAAYSLVSVSTRKLMLEHRLGSQRELSHVEGDIRLLCGSIDATAEEAAKYDIDRIIDASCPPCYLIHGLEDVAVFFSNSELWAKALETHGVPHVLRLVEQTNHAFSTGKGTLAEGWFEDAIAFWKETKQR